MRCGYREDRGLLRRMETYQEFLDRIESFEKRECQLDHSYFNTNPSLAQKVDRDNTFCAFYGDTIVFALDAAVKEKLAGYVDFLYQSAPECFCERLVPHTFHVTLHDLSNSPVLRDVAEELFENELRVLEKREQLHKYANTVIQMKSRYLFNMVNTSLVLGLYPSDADNYYRLMELYCIFDDVRKLNYPFTPHITLAYYPVNGFDVQAAARFEQAVNHLNQNELQLKLRVKQLYYQKFRSMNAYFDVFNLVQ